MHTVVLIAVTCALAIGREAADTPAGHCQWRVFLAVGGILILAGSARLMTLAGCDTNDLPGRVTRRVRWLEGLQLLVWLVVAAFQVFVIDWVTVVRTNWQLKEAVLLDEILILVPLILPWLISWALFYEMDCETRTATPNRRRATGGRGKFVADQARLVLGIGLLPVLAVCLVSDLVSRFAPTLATGTGATFILAAPLLTVLLLYPWILRQLWRTTPLPHSPLRHRLQSLADQHHVRLREMLIWHTDQRVINAAATGVLPGLRYVFFSDGLLLQLTDDEIEAAFAHELGHLRFGHLTMRAIALLVPLSGCLLLDAFLSWWGHAFLGNQIGLGGSDPLATFGALAATLIYMAVGMGWYARRLEHQADLWACDHLAPPGSSRLEGRQRYLSVLRRMTAGLPRQGRGWLHPGWPQRRAFLIETLQDPSTAARFTNQMGWLAAALCGLTLAGGMCLALR